MYHFKIVRMTNLYCESFQSCLINLVQRIFTVTLTMHQFL